MTSRVSRVKARLSDLWEPDDICYHQQPIPDAGGLPQPKAGPKSGGKPPALRSQRRPLEPMGRVQFPKLQSNPALRGLVSPQNVELSACTKGSIKQRMPQNAFGPVHKSLHTTRRNITHGVLILAP